MILAGTRVPQLDLSYNPSLYLSYNPSLYRRYNPSLYLRKLMDVIPAA